MQKQNRVAELAITGVLTALAIMIPLVFTPLRVVIPPYFTATLISHVPSMLAMYMSPFAALGVGLGSALGFTVFTNPVVGARALSHAFFAYVGNVAWRRGMSMWLVMLMALPIHAVFEGIVTWLATLNIQSVVITLVGTSAHHCVDGIITLLLVAVLQRAGAGRWFERERTLLNQ
ncbi:MAG TPA: hypothetical protein VIL07_01585 [Symbiobacteriaceae bacterium]